MTAMIKKSAYPWLLLAGLFAANWFYQIDRALFGIMLVPIQSETGLSDIQAGLCDTVLFVVYACLVPLAGMIGDRFDRARIIPVIVILWSVMTAATGLAGGFLSFVFLRSFATTSPQAFYGPSAYALIAEHHERTRTAALSIHQSAYYFGLLTSGAIVAAILGWVNSWHVVYYLFGAAGLALGLWLLFFLRPEAKPVSVVSRPQLLAGFKAFFRSPGALVGSTAFVAIVFVNNAYAAWAPKFAAVKFGLDPAKAAMSAMFYYNVSSLAAILLVGWLSDRMVARYPRFRMFAMAGALAVGAPVLVVFGHASSVFLTWLSIVLFGIVRAIVEANMFANVFDQLPSETRSTAVGAMSVFAALFGSLSPLFVGVLSDKFGTNGFEIGFATLGGLGLCSAIALCVFACKRRNVLP